MACKNVKSLILTGFGINCEEEMKEAYKKAGAEANIHHINELFTSKVSLHDFDILNFPGGFSFGDDLGSGKVLANKFKFKNTTGQAKLINELKIFLKNGKFILGICNGFQALVKMGLLPDISGETEQEVTLTKNNSNKFEDRWCTININQKTNSPFLKDIKTIDLPVRHGEGKLIIKNQDIRQAIIQNNLCAITYSSDRYPENPNGSELDCAALTDKSGQILGMMPHPEAFISAQNHPDWDCSSINKEGLGLLIFKNISNYIRSNK